MNVKTRVVFATVIIEAIHRWDNAPDEVSFLRNPHRHLFNITIQAYVDHNDRDVEFIMMKHKAEEYCRMMWADKDIGQTSCEMIAEELGEHLSQTYNLHSISVSEDGENGAIITWG